LIALCRHWRFRSVQDPVVAVDAPIVPSDEIRHRRPRWPVYYYALRQERGKLDRYVRRSVTSVPTPSGMADRQLAY
jgi:hypothetical protein